MSRHHDISFAKAGSGGVDNASESHHTKTRERALPSNPRKLLLAFDDDWDMMITRAFGSPNDR
jgi:hypothetical protein